MKKLISISASLLLAGASLVGVSAPAQAVLPSTVISATLDNAGTHVLLKCLDSLGYAGSSTVNLVNVFNGDPTLNDNIYNFSKTISGDTITIAIDVNRYTASDVLTVQIYDSNIVCGGNDLGWGDFYQVAMSKTLTYDANSGAGMITATTGAGALTVSTGTNYTRSGYTLAGWNTLANGNGTPVALGASYAPSQNETLYAQWTAIPVTTPVVVQAPVYTGPEFNAIAGRVVDSVEGGKVVLTGRRLDSVTKISLAGKVLTPTKSTESSIELNVPAGTPGSATLEITFTSGRMTWTNAFDYVDPAVVKAQAANKLPKPAAKPATKPAAKVTKAKPKAKK
jgi:uncharacterized repeat protein (TIGR02543 family)